MGGAPAAAIAGRGPLPQTRGGESRLVLVIDIEEHGEHQHRLDYLLDRDF